MRAIVAIALVFAAAACDSKTSTGKKDEKKAIPLCQGSCRIPLAA